MVEQARQIVAASHDLASQQHATANAFKLYLKTRPPAAPESVHRSKTLPKVGRQGGLLWDFLRVVVGCTYGSALPPNWLSPCSLVVHLLCPSPYRPHPAFHMQPIQPTYLPTQSHRGGPCGSDNTPCPPLAPQTQEGIHPLLAASLPSDSFGGLEAQEALADITAKLKSYRPSHTVFEAEVAAPRRGEGAGGSACLPGLPGKPGCAVLCLCWVGSFPGCEVRPCSRAAAQQYSSSVPVQAPLCCAALLPAGHLAIPGVAASAPHEFQEVMRRKRAVHAATIQVHCLFYYVGGWWAGLGGRRVDAGCAVGMHAKHTRRLGSLVALHGGAERSSVAMQQVKQVPLPAL